MEDLSGEIGENIKEPTEKPAADVEASAKVNGDLNGSLDEAMEVDESGDVSPDKNSVPESSGDPEQPPKTNEDSGNDDESMDVDNNVSDVASDLSVKSDVRDSEDHVDGQPNDSIKNGPSADEQEHKDLVGENNVEPSEEKSEHSDIRDEDNLGNVDNVSADEDASNDPVKKQTQSGSESEHEESEDSPRKASSLQNGESAAECSDADEVKDLSRDSKKEEETPEKSETENKDGESEESPDGSTPSKKGKGRKNPAPLSLTPRRSSRNLNKQKSYAEDKEEAQERDDSSDIEEIAQVDPLSGTSDQHRENKENSKLRASRGSINKTIVVNDAKHLVEIASGSKQSKGLKKEPTLVLIDTNSIVSSRGPISVPQRPGLQITPVHLPSSSSSSGSIQQSFSVLPVGNHNQTVFSGGITAQRVSTPPAPQPAKPPVIVPSLADFMYVIEAPSFIVPYVHETPPIKPLKELIQDLEAAIKKQREEEEEEEKKKKEEEDTSKKKEDEENLKEGKSDDKEEDSVKKENESSDKEEKDEDSEKEVSPDQKKDAKDKSGQDEKSDSKEKDEAVALDKDDKKEEASKDASKAKSDKTPSYFDDPLGKFFMQIGVNLVQEHVQTDLLRSQKKKRDREGGKGGASTQMAISSLQQTLEYSKENNEPFHLKQKKCDHCSFRTESALVMAHHMETPHMRNYIYRCNFCPLEVRSPHDILFHMEAEHNVRGRLERGPAFHQCPNCPFEDNQKGKLTRHLVSCQKRYRPEKNQEPPLDWEPPAKILKVSRSRPFFMNTQGMPGLPVSPKPGMVGQVHPALPKLPAGSSIVGQSNLGQVANSLGRGRGRPPVQGRFPNLTQAQAIQQQQRLQAPMAGMRYRSSPSGPSQVLVPTSYQIAGNSIYQNSKGQTNKLLQQPALSITAIPSRQPAGTPPHAHTSGMSTINKPSHPGSGGKAPIVICEICDAYIKDLEQLRIHMQYSHKTKIHPKMIYNRAPLNCQKCQFRFFTDQGLERHLLGSHGLVTSSMQEAANKGIDTGRCPICGRRFNLKLLNHVARDHNMTLKPAHLSYKCTVCTATFGMYKDFENHVYSAHSVVAKRVIEKKPGGTSSTSSPSVSRSPAQASQGDSLLKPLKINDEITIIPQSRSARPAPTGRSGPLPSHMQGGKQ